MGLLDDEYTGGSSFTGSTAYGDDVADTGYSVNQELNDILQTSGVGYNNVQATGASDFETKLADLAAKVGLSGRDNLAQQLVNTGVAKSKSHGHALIDTASNKNAATRESALYGDGEGDNAQRSLTGDPREARGSLLEEATKPASSSGSHVKSPYDRFLDEYFGTAKKHYLDSAEYNRGAARKFIQDWEDIFSRQVAKQGPYEDFLRGQFEGAKPISFGFKGGPTIGSFQTRQANSAADRYSDHTNTMAAAEGALADKILATETTLVNPEAGYLNYYDATRDLAYSTFAKMSDISLEESRLALDTERLALDREQVDRYYSELVRKSKDDFSPVGAFGDILGLGKDIAGLGGLSGIIGSIFG